MLRTLPLLLATPLLATSLLATLLRATSLLPAAAQPVPTQAAACPEFFPGNRPPSLRNPRLAARTTPLCNDAFAVLASGVTKGPLWSAERLTAESLAIAATTPREGEFHPDDRVPPQDRARLDDYRGSGYDRGHMTPSGDMPGPSAQQQSFALSNMVPQAAPLNRGLWSAIENAVRSLARRRGTLFVVTGPAFSGTAIQSIGPSGVLVPTAVWKAVYDPRTRAAAAYACANTDTPSCTVVSIDDLTAITGIDPFPAMPAARRRTALRLPQPGLPQPGLPTRRHRAY